MEEMTLRIPVHIKARLTQDLKERLKAEMSEALKNADLDLQQMEFQEKKMIAEQARLNANELPRLYAQLDAERSKRNEFIRDTMEQMEHLERLEFGSEISRGMLDGMFTLKVGDNLRRCMGAEILLEDGVIIAFRT
ncbi:MAG: YlqD family protein [Acidaminococcales bacterium]|jgi:Arc/MetJ-type ribon-helix-helix transcriptional regulator|nr:YlqD family protein [Acidaminococcales bacterium]